MRTLLWSGGRPRKINPGLTLPVQAPWGWVESQALSITSVGSPEPVIGPLHEAGCLVFADVATMRHVDRALQLGVDGLVLLTAGAGGQTGWNNPSSFVRAVRERFDGPLVLAGGIGDGAALLGAQVLGADLCYRGTKFIATHESLASQAYRQALVSAGIDDVSMTTQRTGLPANLLANPRSSGVDSDAAKPVTAFDYDIVASGKEAWSAGHSVYGVRRILHVAELIEQTLAEYEQAKNGVLSDLAGDSRPERIS